MRVGVGVGIGVRRLADRRVDDHRFVDAGVDDDRPEHVRTVHDDGRGLRVVGVVGVVGVAGAGGSSTATSSTPAASNGSTPDATTGTGTAPDKRTAPAVVTPDGVGTPRAAVATDTPASVSDAATALTGTPAAGTTIGDVLGSLPTGNLTGLGDIPDLPADGTFTNPQDACVYLASKVNAPAGQEGALGDQFASFCGSLPSSFDALDLTALIGKLSDLLKGLQATPTHPGSTDTRPIHTSWGDLPASFHDLDCSQLSYDEAQAILASDPSDPNHLDGDHDGIACERNPHDYRTVCDDYVGYPVGAVATGDSAPTVDPEIAAALGGLALASVAGATVTRREEPVAESDDPADPTDSIDDLVTAGER